MGSPSRLRKGGGSSSTLLPEKRRNGGWAVVSRVLDGIQRCVDAQGSSILLPTPSQIQRAVSMYLLSGGLAWLAVFLVFVRAFGKSPIRFLPTHPQVFRGL